MCRPVLFVPLAVAVMLGGCGGGGAPGGSGGAGAGGSPGGRQGGNGGATGGMGGGMTGSGGTGSGSLPGAFALVSPLQGSSAQPLTPTLQWNTSDSASSYTVEVATSSTFGTTDVVNQSVGAPATDLVVAPPLTAGVIYYWQVTAVNAGGETVAMGGPQRFSSPVAANEVEVITLSTDAITSISLMNDAPGEDFHNVAITPDGTVAVVVGSASIQVVSLANNTVLSSYPGTGGTSAAVSMDGKTAFVSDMGDGWVRVLQIP